MTDENLEWPFTHDSIIANAPPKSGIYLIFNSTGQCIFVGDADNIQAKLLNHINKKEPEDSCIANLFPETFSYVEAIPSKREQTKKLIIRGIPSNQPLCK